MKNNNFEYFDKIYCIHLPESTDRWNNLKNDLLKHNIYNDVIKISAPRPPKNLFLQNMVNSGQLGCTMSHLKMLGHALKHARGNILIIEDDIKFTNNDNLISSTINWMKTNPWDIFYFGGQPQNKVTKITNNIYTVNSMRGTYGYVVTYEKIHSLYNFFIDSLVSDKTEHAGICDYILGDYARTVNSKAVYPLITIPTPNTSLIQNKEVSHYNLTEQRWKACL